MKIQIINPIEYRNWDELLHTTDQSCFFHTAAWAEVLNGAYGYKPLYFSIIEDGKLRGLIPVMEINSHFTGRRGVSLPFTDHSPPIAEDQVMFDTLFDHVRDYAHAADWKFLEFKGGGGFLNSEAPYTSFNSHILELDPDTEAVLKAFRNSTRRNIHKAEKSDLTVALHYTRKALKSFYRLHCMTRKFHGLPPQPWSFFDNVFKHVIAKHHGFVLLALHKGKAVAGAVHFVFQDQVLFKYGAFDRSYQHLRPNNLVMWEAIKWCCANGIHSFNLGRTEPENKGLIQFKRGWGAIESTIKYFNYNLKQAAFNSNGNRIKSSYNFFKILPAPVLRFAGDIFYKHAG